MGGMALAGWLAQGVQGSAHAINKAGSLRMQSYRLLAAVPVGTTRTDMFNEMERTAWSDELQQAAVRDGQQAALLAIQRYWRQHLAPALRDAPFAAGGERASYAVCRPDRRAGQRL